MLRSAFLFFRQVPTDGCQPEGKLDTEIVAHRTDFCRSRPSIDVCDLVSAVRPLFLIVVECLSLWLGCRVLQGSRAHRASLVCPSLLKRLDDA